MFAILYSGLIYFIGDQQNIYNDKKFITLGLQTTNFIFKVNKYLFFKGDKSTIG